MKEMNEMKGRIKVLRGQSSEERLWDRLKRIGMKKWWFSAACEIVKKIVREENEIEKNENKDGELEHSKEQELESRAKCQKFCA